MTPYASPRLVPYLGLAALGLIAALALRRPELVVVAAPFALIVAAGLLLEGRPEVKAWLTIERERTLEGEEIVAEIELNATGSVDLLELHLVIPHGLTVVDGDNPSSIRLGADEERTISLTLRCDRWGAVELGDIYLRARGRIGMLAWEGRVRRPHRIQIYPRPELLQSLVAPLDTQLATGDLVARVRADGLEFADTRQFVPGDRLRSVNWRASARRGELIVNERHPDRNADVVLFLDSFAEARSDDEADGTLELAVRAAATLAGRYLERRDRVGLVTFGGILRWLEPGGGLVQRYRLIDALLETGVEFSYAWKDVNIIPGADAAAEGARDRGDAAPRRALDHGAARPSRPRPRPGDRRGLARGARRARRRPRRPGVPALAPAARRVARPLRALRASPWRGGRTMCRSMQASRG